jgi:hypothetical protein
MTIMEGDGLNGQPAEGGVSLESMAEQLDDETPQGDEDSEESEESEEVESEGDEDAEDADSEEDAEEPTFTIKVDGKDVALKQSELIEQAQKGFDYTKKTMALAEERKAIEPVRQQAEQLRQQNDQALKESMARLDAYAKFMESQIGQPPPITLAQSDAASYLAQKELHEARKGQLQQALAERQRLQEDMARQRQSYVNQKVVETENVLKDTLPGWNDALVEDLSAYTRKLGLTPETGEFALLEPGFWQMAHKAKAYDALMAEKAKLKPVKELPKVNKPRGNNPPPQSVKRQEAIKAHQARPTLDSLAGLT